jgi:hypothetical protein
MINVHTISVSIPEGKRRLRTWRSGNSDTEIDVKGVLYRDVYVMQLIQHSDIYRMNSKKSLMTILIQSQQNFEFDGRLSTCNRNHRVIRRAIHKF